MLRNFAKLDGGTLQGHEIVWASNCVRSFHGITKRGKVSPIGDGANLWRFVEPRQRVGQPMLPLDEIENGEQVIGSGEKVPSHLLTSNASE